MGFITNITQWIGALPWANVYSTTRGVFIVADVVLFIAFIYVLMQAFSVRPRFSVGGKLIKFATLLRKDAALGEKWRKIVAKLESAPPQSYTLTIIDADKFVDDILKKLGLKGEHMADRLEVLGGEDLVSLDRLWRAHRIRNALVHSPGFAISERDAKEVLEAYEAFLKEIGLL